MILSSHSKIFCCLTLLAFSVLLSLMVGSSGISIELMLKAISESLSSVQQNNSDQNLAATIFWHVRLPRTLLVALVGGALAASGVLTQGLFRNPLASPSLLSMEAGAGLAGVITLFYVPDISHWYTLPLISCLGAWLTTAVMLLWTRSAQGNSRLLLTGVALGTFFSALSSLLISLHANDYNRATMVMRWLLGGFSGRGLEHLPMILVPCLIGSLFVVRLLPALDVLVLGETTSMTLGISVTLLRWSVVSIVGMWLGGAVAVSGSIPFVGLIVPHLGRRIFGPKIKPLMIGSLVLGMSLTLIADTLGRSIAAPHEIEVGIMMALIGSPLFLWILHQSIKQNTAQGEDL